MKKFTQIALLLLALVFFGLALVGPVRGRSLADISNMDGLHLFGSFGTATPQLLIENQGSGASIEVRSTSGASMFRVDADGAISASGVLTNSTMPNLVVSAPTAVGTATPAVYVNSAGVSNPVDIRDGGVVRIQAYDGGGVLVAAPTAVGTAVPALYVDTAGVSNVFEVRKNATPVTSFAGDGSNVLGTGSISAGEIADVTRRVNIPLGAFFDCETNAGAAIGFDTTADALADYVNSSTDGLGRVIRFDDTSGTEDQNMEICSEISIPADYASGGAFTVRALKDGHSGATEVINCAGSVNGAALEAAGTVTTSASASTSYSCTPTIAALAAGDSLSFYLSITSDSTMNDVVDIASVAFSYTATQ